MGSCPDGEAVRGGGRLTARERQAPEEKERSDYRSDDPPKGDLRRPAPEERERRSKRTEAEKRSRFGLRTNLRSDVAEGR